MLSWNNVVRNNVTYLYAKTATNRYDGDEAGHEWECGFSLHKHDGNNNYDLYEDDGEGNGNYIHTGSLQECKKLAEAYDTSAEVNVAE